MKTTTLAALAILGLPAGTAHAHHPFGPGVNHRQAHQHLRIDGGVASGALTRGETRFLAGQQRTIRAEERLYRSDGVFTPAERVDLHRAGNRDPPGTARSRGVLPGASARAAVRAVVDAERPARYATRER